MIFRKYSAIVALLISGFAYGNSAHAFLKTTNLTRGDAWITIYSLGHASIMKAGGLKVGADEDWSGPFAYGSFYHIRAEVRDRGLNCDTQIQVNPTYWGQIFNTAVTLKESNGNCYWTIDNSGP